MKHTETKKSTGTFFGGSIESVTAVITRQAHRALKWLVLLFAISPIFVLIKSITLPYHEAFYINTNQRTLAEFWCGLLKLSGYYGLVFTFLAALGGAREMSREKGWLWRAIHRHPVLLFLSLLLAWSFFSCLLSDNFTRSFYGTDYLRDGFLSYLAYAGLFCCAYLMKMQNDRMLITRFFTGTAAVVSILVLVNNDMLKRMLSLVNNAAIFHNINHCGYYLCLAVMTAATLFLTERSKSISFMIWLPVYTLINVALLKNGSFGPYVAVIGGLAFLIVFAFLYVKKVKLQAVILVVVFIAVSFVFNLKTNYLKNEAFTLRQDIVNIVENNESASMAGSYRWIIWKKSVRYALEKPVFGYGPENLGKRFGQDELSTGRPHNVILQLAASLGIPAALFFTAALFFLYWDLLKNRKKLTIEALGLHSAVFTYLLSSMFGVSAFYTTPFFFIYLGLTCNLFRDEADVSKSVPVPVT